jgi:CubicO group peptidase (beta-lactamase class C family)
MTSDTLVRVASITKTFTALAAMQLVERGQLQLDRDVNEYLDFAIPALPGRAPVTLRRLLGHLTGFEDRRSDIGAWNGPRVQLGPYLARHMPPRLNQGDSIVAYSNYNAALAAYIVERASGQPFEQYLGEHIFQPLQMIRTTAVQPVPDQLLPLVSSGYLRSDVPPTLVSMATATIYEVGSTGIVTSGDDMARLMIALLRPDPGIVSRATLDAMMTSQTSVPRGIAGLGFFAPLGSGGNVFIGHDGGTGGFQSTLALMPSERFGIFASYNSEGIPTRVSAIGELLARVSEREFAHVSPPGTIGSAADVSGVFGPARRVDSNLFALRSLSEQVAVQTDGNTVMIRPALLPVSEPVDQIAAGLFRWSGRDVSFSGSGASTTMQIGSSSTQFLRVPWWSSASIVVPGILACALIAASTILAWPVSLLRQRHARPDATIRRLRTTVRLALLFDLLAIGGALWLVFGAEPLVALSSSIVKPFGIGIYTFAWAGVLLTPLTLWYGARFVMQRPGGPFSRWREGALVATHVILTAFCLYWRIAGTTITF